MDKLQVKKVFIVDDHPIMRYGLTQFINETSDLQVCGDAKDGVEVFEKLKKQTPDIVIVDLSLGGSSGLEVIKDMRIRYPNLPILVLSMHEESLYIERALRAGARGYIMKKEMEEKILIAIRKILQGHIYTSDKVTSDLLNKFLFGAKTNSLEPLDSLSNRELEIFQLIAQGLSSKEMAEKLCISVNTIETHRRHIKKKLNLPTTRELYKFAFQREKNV